MSSENEVAYRGVPVAKPEHASKQGQSPLWHDTFWSVDAVEAAISLGDATHVYGAGINKIGVKST